VHGEIPWSKLLLAASWLGLYNMISDAELWVAWEALRVLQLSLLWQMCLGGG